LHSVFNEVRWTLRRYQVDPISTRRLSASTFMNVVMPTARSVVRSITAKGSMLPWLCCTNRFSISPRMASGDGTNVYQSFHNSPSHVASTSWSCRASDSGSRVTVVLCRVTGVSQVMVGLVASSRRRHA